MHPRNGETRRSGLYRSIQQRNKQGAGPMGPGWNLSLLTRYWQSEVSAFASLISYRGQQVPVPEQLKEDYACCSNQCVEEL